MSNVPNLSRPAFFDGQALTAADLTAVQDYHCDLLWRHQRTLHGWGIASGFAVAGATSAKTVDVAPGYAIDSGGRSIVLTHAQTVDVPAVVSGPTGKPATYYLTVTYVEDADLAATVRTGVCGSNGAVRRPEQPLLRWRDSTSVDLARVVVLGEISVQNCKLAAPIDTASRRSAIPDRQPYIYAGQAASLSWAVWRLPEQDPADPPIGLKVMVTTSEAGFANTPQYTAQVVGSRVVEGDPGFVLDGYVEVASASSTGFQLLMTLPRGDALVNPASVIDSDQLKDVPGDQGWYISWLGVEG